MAGSTRDGDQGGSNVIVTSTDSTPGTRAALFTTPSFRKPVAGHPGVVAVIVIRTAPSETEMS